MDFNKIQGLKNYPAKSFFLLAGPCVVENEDISRNTAETLKEITDELGIPFIFKASYRKANRSSHTSFSGIGDQKALEILAGIKKDLGLPLVTDIHLPEEAAMAAAVVDILQIPAFLCRQTDLLVAAAETGKAVNIKKGQFMSAQSMKFSVDKVRAAGNNQVMLTERGTTFGYQDLIVDFRGIPEMKKTGCPVILDATHSLQQPNQSSGITGGLPEMISVLAKAGIAAGADGIFIETHPDPSRALSDGANMLPLDKIKSLLESLLKVYRAVHE